MAQFTDSQGRDWQVYIDIGIARKVRQQTGVNILVQDGLSQLGADPILLVEALYVLCEQQCQTRGVDPEDFGRSLRGESIEAAGDALVEALLDFSPPRQRRVLAHQQAATQVLLDTLAGMAEERIPKAVADLKRLIPGLSSLDTPESSDSTPGT